MLTCLCWSSSLCLGVKRHLSLSTPAGRLLSLHPCSAFILRLFPPREPGHCGPHTVGLCSPAAASFPHGPTQDKAVIAPGIAGLSSSSSKQICCNFICNWALNWEQIEAALCSLGKGEGRELGVVGEAGEMIPASFMSGKVGLLSGREPRQGSYF